MSKVTVKIPEVPQNTVHLDLTAVEAQHLGALLNAAVDPTDEVLYEIEMNIVAAAADSGLDTYDLSYYYNSNSGFVVEDWS